MTSCDPQFHRVRRTYDAKLWATLLSVLWLVLLVAPRVHAALVPVGFADTQVAGGLTSPSSMTVLPDGRLLIVQQDGRILLVKNDVLQAASFYQVANVDAGGERGCLGIVADPSFSANHFLYFYCTVFVGGGARNQILRVTEANDAVVAGSERVIFALPNLPPGTQWHMGGALRFGSDGKLYVAVGNHEDGTRPFELANSQNLTNPFGKILRINADGTVPSDNPFFSTPGAYQANWSFGLRNPFTFDIQPGTGLMHINDVGHMTFEEINRGVAGANYGWPAVEGTSNDPRFTNPIYTYPRFTGCAISGGAFYNPSTPQFPASYLGKYLFADFCSGSIYVFDPNNPSTADVFVTRISHPINIAVGPDGSLYYLARNEQTGVPTAGVGTAGKITFTNTAAPRITQHPQSQTALVGSSVTFTVLAEGATSFQWRRDGIDIPGATSASYAIAAVQASDDRASFSVLAINALGSASSSAAVLTVTANLPPTAVIDSPAPGATFAVGDEIFYGGTGTDAEDGALPASAFSWQLSFQHDTHGHAFGPAVTGQKSGSVRPTDFEADVANTWLRLFLTVTDSGGQTSTASRDIFPRRALSSMTPIAAPVNGWGPIELDRSNGETAAGDGRNIGLGGIPYPKGLGMHAPAEVRYDLGGTCTGSFISDVGVDDEVGDLGSVVFQVFVDGALAFDSGVVRGNELRRAVRVSAAGRRELRLVVTDGGDGNGFDHASWGGARVTGCDAAPQLAVTNLSVKDTANAADWALRSNLQAGDLAFGDRGYTFANVPAAVAGARWIRSANDSKAYSGNPLLTFDMTASADVYVAIDDRGARPPWVDANWSDTGMDLTIRETSTATRTFSLHRRRYPVGQVALGPWNDVNTTIYTVLIK